MPFADPGAGHFEQAALALGHDGERGGRAAGPSTSSHHLDRDFLSRFSGRLKLDIDRVA